MSSSDGPIRIAMWSGPRNISTALMRAWENRGDTVVVDEPFYAYYLHATRAPHPLAEEIIARYPTDWRVVVEQLTTGDLGGKAVFYQKQMTHHLLPEVGRDWLAQVTNCFLLRHPAEVIESYVKKNYAPTALDLGFPQQVEVYDAVCKQTNSEPLIIEASDVLQNPRGVLGSLCEALGVPWTDRMLSWPPGYRESDGVWAPHWYGEVVKTTGFAPYRPRERRVPDAYRAVFDECLACYDRLYPRRLRA